MKNSTFSTLFLSAFIVLITASFGYASYEVAPNNFPYFHVGCLVMGGLIITSLKTKYSELRLSEAVGSFALYSVLIALFTSPVVNAIKYIVS